MPEAGTGRTVAAKKRTEQTKTTFSGHNIQEKRLVTEKKSDRADHENHPLPSFFSRRYAMLYDSKL